MPWQMIAFIRNGDFIKVRWGNEKNVFTSEFDAVLWKEEEVVEKVEFNSQNIKMALQK